MRGFLTDRTANSVTRQTTRRTLKKGKMMRKIILALGLILTASSLSGCAVAVIGAAGVGAASGYEHHEKNKEKKSETRNAE